MSLHEQPGYILLVEDNQDDAELTLRAFHKSDVGSDVVVVRDGAEALDFLFGRGQYAGRDSGDTPQVVLLDIQLPKLSGLQVLEAMRGEEHTRLVPVVMLSTSAEERDIAQSYVLGANSYIRKPVNFDAFLRTVEQLGRYWLAVNQPHRAHAIFN